MMNKLRALNSLWDTIHKNNMDMNDHVAHVESSFPRLVALGSTFEEPLKVDILLSSAKNHG